MHFSREKLSEAAQYPTPINAKQLRSFLSLAQYYARHVENYVQWAEPMRAVHTTHDKSRKWVWSQAAEAGFLGMQDAIRLCPKLYFVSDDPAHKIYLRTDASQYGYGAYLFQEKDGEEWPILFRSRSFHKAELKWHIEDKEGFAIFVALDKFQYLLHTSVTTYNSTLLFLSSKSTVAHDCDPRQLWEGSGPGRECSRPE